MQKPRTGAANARLNLVEYQKRAGSITCFPSREQITGRRRHHTTLTQHGFEKYRRRAIGNRSVQGIGVARFGRQDVVRHPLVGRIVEAYDQRATAARDAKRDSRPTPVPRERG